MSDMSRQVCVWDRAKKKMVYVGVIVKQEFHHDVKKQHFCWKYHGFGLQEDALAMIRKAGVESIVIHHWDGYTLVSKPEEWTIKDDIGNGMQVFLAENKMTRTGDAHADERLF